MQRKEWNFVLLCWRVVAIRTHCARIATLLRWQHISLCAFLISRPSCVCIYISGQTANKLPLLNAVDTSHIFEINLYYKRSTLNLCSQVCDILKYLHIWSRSTGWTRADCGHPAFRSHNKRHKKYRSSFHTEQEPTFPLHQRKYIWLQVTHRFSRKSFWKVI